MTVAFFADMDGTTIYSKRHIPGRESGYTGLVVVETHRGEPLSFMTYDAVRALSGLSRRLAFVPTTTRDRAQFDRIEIPDVHSRYAIIANGGRILVDGVEDQSWTEKVTRAVSGSTPPADVLAEMQVTLGKEQPWLYLVDSSSDLFGYVVAKRGESVPEWFGEFLESRAPDWGFTLSAHGRTTYLIPEGLTKEKAAAEVASRIGADIVFASGDSLLDIGLMRFATHAIQPHHGELNTCALDLARTTSSGIAAGREILDFVASRLDAGPDSPPGPECRTSPTVSR